MDIENVIRGLDQLFVERKSDQVEDYLSKHLEEALKEGDIGAAITIINELIGFYRDSSQYDKAEAYCEKLLPFMERAGLKDTIHYGTSCLNIANAYRAAGKWELSLQYYEQVQSIYQKVLDAKDFRWASYRNNLSLLYQEMGRFEDACQALSDALRIVKEYPEAKVELAVTYTNLAVSYTKAGKLQEAEEAIQQGLVIFRDGLTEDYHYSAALSALGDILVAEKEYEKAVEAFQQAMALLRSHVGLTHAYFRLVCNVQMCYEQLGKPYAMKGLELAQDYYEKYAKKSMNQYITHGRLGTSEGKQGDKELTGSSEQDISVAVGKVGEGSECFGMDDIFSMDHDFGPGFDLFVTREQYEKDGAKLEEFYANLPDTFRGLQRPVEIPGKPRNGVIVIEDFLGRVLNLSEEEMAYVMEHENLPDSVYLRVEDWQLATVTNGRLFEGTDTVFGRIYTNLKKGYPQEIKRRKLAQALGLICQSGQYNYERMMKRGELESAVWMLHEMEEQTIQLLYLVNDVYMPHRKWQLIMARQLKEGQDILQEVQAMMAEQPSLDSYRQRETVDWIGSTNTNDPIVERIHRIAESVMQLLKRMGYTTSDAVYLEDQIPYVLQEKKEGTSTMKEDTITKEELVDAIVRLEWNAFDKVENEGGRADCQNDWNTFSVMRKSQYLAWPKELLESFYVDFVEANDRNWNLITEKYGRMMESTTPEEYAKIADRFPVCSEQKRAIVDQIAEIQVEWMEAFAKEYPYMAGNARTIRKETDNPWNTSYETYLKGELLTYSDRTLSLYGRWIVSLKQADENLAKQIMTNTALLYGYASLDAAEEALAKQES